MRDERVRFGLRGFWRDRVYGPDGALDRETQWQHNQIQDGAYLIIAGLLARFVGSEDTEFGAVRFLAVGSGDESWDETSPTIATSADELENESFRKAFSSGSVVFVDESDEIVVGPTARIMIEVSFGPFEANGVLREFALFGGTASTTADSGTMFNVVTHPPIEKEEGYTLIRSIILEVSAP